MLPGPEMGFILLAVFIGLPLIEIAVFIAVGERVGLWPTLGLVILTAVVGTTLLRSQGLSTLMRAQAATRRGELPLTELFEGLYLVIAGLLLLTPGFVTDALGLTLFIPWFRQWLGYRLFRSLQAHGHIHTAGFGTGGPDPDGHGPVIDGDYQEVPGPPERKADEPPDPDNRPPVVRPNDTC